MDIISYATFKKRVKPTICEVRDGGGKGWCCDTVQPTMHSAGWNVCIIEYDYRLFDEEKPKDMAIRLLKEVYGEKWLEGKKFVYYPYYYHGNNCCMDCLYVYWKDTESK